MSISFSELTPAQESLFLTLGSRALDSRLPRPFLGDTKADEIITGIDYPLNRFPQLSTRLIDRRSKVFDVAVRTKRLDDIVRRFVARQPDAVVLDLGAGLDDRLARVAPPSSVGWFDVDFPAVIQLRRQLLPEPTNAHYVAADLTHSDWLRDIPTERPAVIVADGLLPFLADDDVVALVKRLVDHFPSGELVLNAYTTYGIRVLKHSRAMRTIGPDVANTGVNNPQQPEHWVNGLTLIDEMLLTRAPEVADLPLIGRVAFRLAAHSDRVSRRLGTMVWHYRF